MNKLALILFALSFAYNGLLAQRPIAVEDLYAALSGEDPQPVAQALDMFPEPVSTNERAYKGVLLMKSASAKDGVSEKLETFKQGHELLEAAIAEQPANTEFRFLRLIIQENAPRILGYYKNVKDDKEQIVGNYNQLSEALKNAIVNYASHSEVLLKEDFE